MSSSRIPDWRTASEAAWQVARRREAIVRPLADLSPLTIERVDEAAHALGVSRSFVYRLVARYRRRRHTSSLLPRIRGRAPRARQLDPRLESLVATTIDTFYLTEQRPRLADLIRTLTVQCRQHRLHVPCYLTVKRRVEAIDRKLIVARRLGFRAAQHAFGPVRTSPLNALQPLDMLQVDHTPVDVMVVDEQDRLPIGRPWLTLAIAVASRVVAGFTVSLEAPSTVSVALVLTHAVLPKETWLADRQLEIEWPVSGIPEYLHVDNGPEFEAAALVRGAEEHGMALVHRPVRQPSYGGHIERLIGTMMGAVHLLPGTTFSNVAQKGEYPSESRATLTLAELERWLALEIAAYHERVHTALRRPPLRVWRDGLARRPHPPRQASDPQRFFIDFLPAVRRRVRRDGIRVFAIQYWDNILSPLAGRSPQLMDIRYDPRNLSRIFLRHADGSFWTIPYADLRWPPVSLWKQRAARARLTAKGRGEVDTDTLMRTVAAQRRVIDDAQRQTMRTRRQRARRPHPVADRSPERPLSTPLSVVAPVAPGAVVVEEWE
jgi:putative transposase